MTTDFDPDEAENHLNRSTLGDYAYSELLLRRAIDRVRELLAEAALADEKMAHYAAITRAEKAERELDEARAAASPTNAPTDTATGRATEGCEATTSGLCLDLVEGFGGCGEGECIHGPHVRAGLLAAPTDTATEPKEAPLPSGWYKAQAVRGRAKATMAKEGIPVGTDTATEPLFTGWAVEANGGLVFFVPQDKEDVIKRTGAVDLFPHGVRPAAPTATEPRAIDMVHDLHRAIHGDSWAKPQPPREVWDELLAHVEGMAAGRCHVCMTKDARPAAPTVTADWTEEFRAALMREHADDWDMETVAEAAHTCADALNRLLAEQGGEG
jgi:hypothetical protein